YHSPIAVDSIEDPEREASHPGTSRIPVDDCVAEWYLRDCRESGLHFIQELVAETRTLRFVLDSRLFQIVLGFGPKVNCDRHSRRGMSAIASAASRPGFLSRA